MKIAIYISLAILLLAGIALTSAVTAETNTDEETDSTEVYACPMFCDEWLTTDPDAKCPVCNMSVENVEELYVCPDHPDEFSLEPDSVCTESGEAFIPVEELYVCPMHPDEITTDPEAGCNICGMDLVPVGFGHHDGDTDDHHGEETSRHGCGSGHSCGSGH